ncbi:hypothetical protein GDO86_006835, partial [Hymenochirus boettgeri]
MAALHLMFLFVLCSSAFTDIAPIRMQMDTFLSLVKELESKLPISSAPVLLKDMLAAASLPFHCSPFSMDQANLTSTLLTHKVLETEDGKIQEQGVVLAPDGSTVALRPLLETVVWGWKSETDCDQMVLRDTSVRVDNKDVDSENVEGTSSKDSCTNYNDYQPNSLFLSLGLAFLSPAVPLDKPLVVADGCWDSITDPKTFLLQSFPCHSGLTLAFVNGALDGAILGEMIRNGPKTQNLSSALQDYYWGKTNKSPYRRQNFQAKLEGHNLEKIIQKAIHCYAYSQSGNDLGSISEDQLKNAAGAAAREFMDHFLECPAVIQRCMWGAKPYKGKPTFLKLPLSYVFIHHTYEPSQPCTSFHQCAADMRSMQDFHQQDRGWDDIGYSYVVGSDGYLYEGRGWYWVGAHTMGKNSVGYGVSFIGNYTSTVPKDSIMCLVKDRFLQCALRLGYITPDYNIQGHRQVVDTSCPGDALFREIQSWEHFK